MSGKLQPISSLQPAPLSEAELLARLKRKNIFTKVGKESPETKMAAFREAVLAESKVLQESYKQHRRKHLQFVLEARQARNLNIADLQQELDELEGKKEEEEEEKAGIVAGGDETKAEEKTTEEKPETEAKKESTEEKPAEEKTTEEGGVKMEE